MKVLIVAAHPDDEVLAMGGTIAKHIQRGDQVQMVFLATGILARYRSNQAQVKQLHQDARRVAKILGVPPPQFESFPDNQMDSVPLLRIVKKIEKYIEKIRPEIIYTHNPKELNIDHKITYQAVITATRPFAHQLKAIYAFSVPEANMYNFPFEFAPNHFVDINETLKQKIKAMEAYSSEVRQVPHVRSIEGIKIVAAYYGFMAGVKYAEPFILIRDSR